MCELSALSESVKIQSRWTFYHKFVGEGPKCRQHNKQQMHFYSNRWKSPNSK